MEAIAELPPKLQACRDRLRSAMAAGDRRVVLIADGYRGSRYNIIQYGGCFLALARSEGAFDPESVLRGETKEAVHVGLSLADVTGAIDADPGAFHLPGTEAEILALRHEDSHYAILRYGVRFFAVAQDDLPFDIVRVRSGRCRRLVHEGASRDEVQALLEADPWAWSADPAPPAGEPAAIAPAPAAGDMAVGIELGGATIAFPQQARGEPLKRRFVRGFRAAAAPTIPILREVNLSVRPGERVGILGRNGCGKTTLLKAISGIYPLTAGTRRVVGSVAPVIAQGVGFDHALSVRTNVKLAIAHMGRLASFEPGLESTILGFAELAHRADLPLQLLSSGQIGRLAFAITLFQTPDILILDEVFATGDIAFVRRAIAAMTDRIRSTPIVLLVSHDLATLERICTRCIMIAEGRIVDDGPPARIIAAYRSLYAPAG